MGVFGLFEKTKVLVVWQKEQCAPVFDSERRLRIYTAKKLFEESYKKDKSAFWNLPLDAIQLKQITDIEKLYNTMYIHYGCQSVVIDDALPEGLKEKVTLDLTHFDKNTQGYEVSNPELRMCIVLFNMLLHTGHESVTDALYNEILSHLRTAQLLIPSTAAKGDEEGFGTGSELATSMNINNSKKLIAYTSFEAIPLDLKKKGFTSGLVQSVDELIESALSENVDIAVNCGGSFGGGVLVTHDDMFKIKGVWDIFSEAERYRAAEEFDKAAPLYEQAAAAGYNKAQNNLAVLLQNGAKNVPADIERAIYWYEKASATLGVSAFSLG